MTAQHRLITYLSLNELLLHSSSNFKPSKAMQQTGFIPKMKRVGAQLTKFFKDVVRGRIKIDVHSFS